MSHSNSFSSSHNNPEVDDSSTAFDADTVTSDTSDEILSLPSKPNLPPLLVTTIENHHQQPNNDNNIEENSTCTSSSRHPRQESPSTSISELTRRINSQHSPDPAVPTTTAAAITTASSSASEEKEISSSNLNQHKSKSPQRPRRQSSRLRQKPNQSYVDIDTESMIYDGDYELNCNEEISTDKSSDVPTTTTTKTASASSSEEKDISSSNLNQHKSQPPQPPRRQSSRLRQKLNQSYSDVDTESMIYDGDYELNCNEEISTDKSSDVPSPNTSKATASSSEEKDISSNNQHQQSTQKSQSPQRPRRQSSRLRQKLNQSYVDIDTESMIYDEDYELNCNEEISTNETSDVPTTTTTKTKTKTASASEEKDISSNNQCKSQSPQRPRRQSSRLRQKLNQSYSDVDTESMIYDGDYELNYNESSSLSSSSSQTSTTGERISLEARWNNKFQKLCAYKQLHGHTNVPIGHGSLTWWVRTQRKQYNKKKAKKKSTITSKRIKMLESIGFEWVVENSGRFQKNESEWNKRFTELVEFKEKHGHTNISRNSQTNRPLAAWVVTQRTKFKEYQRTGKTRITEERIKMLNSIGFNWVCTDRYNVRQIFESKWNKRFQELYDFKKQFHHTNVPSKSKTHKQLATWVYTQKKQYRLMTQNKRHFITKERIQKLNSIGFRWNFRK